MDEWLMTAEEAGRQADAVLRLEGDAPDELSQALRAALDRGEMNADQYRAAVIDRAEKEGWITPAAS